MNRQQVETPNFNDGDILLPAIAQDVDSGRVLMLGWMNQEAFAETVKSSFAVYYSRSRQKLWKKGESSGHTQHVEQICIDCDADAILLRVKQQGAACHEGYASCFFRELTPAGWQALEPRQFDPKEVYQDDSQH